MVMTFKSERLTDLMIKFRLYPFFLFLALVFLQACEEQFPYTYSYNKSYSLDYDVLTVLKRFEQLNKEEKFQNPALSSDTDRANHFGDFEGERLYFRHYGETSKFDTLRVFDQNGDTIPGDPYDLVEKRTVRLDSHFLSPDGYFTYYFWPEKAAGCYEIRSLLKLVKKGDGSELFIEKIRVGACGGDIDTNGDKMEDFIWQAFEERVLIPIKG